MSRLYTLWLYASQFPADIALIIISILQLLGFVDQSGIYYRNYIDLVQITGKFLTDIATSVYRMLALLMVSATFMSYTFPFTFQRVFHASRRNKLYLGGFIIVVFHNLNGNLQTALVVKYGMSILPEKFYEVWYSSILALSFAISFFLLLFYLLSIYAICRYAKKRPNGSNSNKSHRKQLISVIVYATTPNIVVLNSLLAHIFAILIATIPTNERSQSHPTIMLGGFFNSMVRYANYIRVPILTISTFIAFSSYRRILMSLIPFRTTVVHVTGARQTQTETNSVSARLPSMHARVRI